MLRNLLRDKGIGQRIVPIIPDEARTFGMDALFKEVKIYAPLGQLYEPVDSKLMLSYSEAKDGQILEEGITEAGGMADFTAAGTAYATWGQPMIPFFIFYSMFGFQRVGDLIWAFGDMRGRGFLLGATAGRTTLLGEGLQHDDGHSLLLASTVPNVQAYDPAFAYEVAAIVADGITRMYGPEPEDIFYYLTLYNENYQMPAHAGRRRRGDRAGPVPLRRGARRARPAGPRSCSPARRRRPPSRPSSSSPSDHDVAAELWSATSYKALREDALSVERWNRLHPGLQPALRRTSPRCSTPRPGPDRGGHRLHEGGARPDRPLGARPLRAARHRRLRPVRHPGGAAPPLRDRRRPRGRGRARRAAGRRRGQGRGGRPTPSPATASTPTPRILAGSSLPGRPEWRV